MVAVDVKHHCELEQLSLRAQELCESRSCRPVFPVSNSPYDLCGRKTTMNEVSCFRAQELCESEVVVLVSSFPIVLFISVDVKQH